MILSAGKKLLMSAGGATDPDALALIRRMTVRPSPKRQRLINKTIVGLKTAGIWVRLDAFYMLAAHTEQASFLNWRQNRFNCVQVGAQSFVADRGFKASGQTTYLRTGFVVGRDADTLFETRLNHVAAHINAPTSSGNRSLGYTASNGGNPFNMTAIRPNIGGQADANLDNNTADSVATTIPEVMVRGSRIASGAGQRTIVNKAAAVATNLQAVNPAARGMFCIGLPGGDEAGNPSSLVSGDSRLIRFVAFGGNGAAVESDAYFDIIQTYLKEVGAIP